MLDTPSFSHLKAADYDRVYEPSEDTFLLLDALEADIERLRRQRPLIALEVGCGRGHGLFSKDHGLLYASGSWLIRDGEDSSGSGCVSTFLAMHLNQTTAFITTDINSYACDATLRTARSNKVGARIDPVHADLVTGLFPRLRGAVDVLLFNPPYVPTPPEEVIDAAAALSASVGSAPPPLAAAWAGGVDGRQVIDRLIPLLPQLLSAPVGVAYMVLVEENRPQQIANELGELGLAMEIVLRRRSGPERLMIARITHKEVASNCGE